MSCPEFVRQEFVSRAACRPEPAFAPATDKTAHASQAAEDHKPLFDPAGQHRSTFPGRHPPRSVAKQATHRGSTRPGTFPAAFSSASPATPQRPRQASAATLSPGRATGSRNKSPVYHLRTLATTSETRRKSTQILALSESWAPCGTPAGNRATTPDGVVHRASPRVGGELESFPCVHGQGRAPPKRPRSATEGRRARPPRPRIYVRSLVPRVTRLWKGVDMRGNVGEC